MERVSGLGASRWGWAGFVGLGGWFAGCRVRVGERFGCDGWVARVAPLGKSEKEGEWRGDWERRGEWRGEYSGFGEVARRGRVGLCASRRCSVRSCSC